MNISRKEFLAKGVARFGRDLFRAFNGEESQLCDCSDISSLSLMVDNRRCLAQRGGCFCCIDRCPHEAISILLGVGVTIDVELCDECGKCIESCPVEPKVIAMRKID